MNKELSKLLEKLYPDYVISPRISEIIYKQIFDEYNGVPIDISTNNVELCNFLKRDKVDKFIADRQPHISTIPEEVIENIVSYFDNGLSIYTPVQVCRKSNHKSDDYLYSVIAENIKDNSYACWSTYNNSTRVLNHGHYGLADKNEALDIIRDTFFDVTDDIEHFGPEQSLKDITADKLSTSESVSANIRRRTR